MLLPAKLSLHPIILFFLGVSSRFWNKDVKSPALFSPQLLFSLLFARASGMARRKMHHVDLHIIQKSEQKYISIYFHIIFIPSILFVPKNLIYLGLREVTKNIFF